MSDKAIVGAITQLQRDNEKVSDKPGVYLPFVPIAGAEPYTGNIVLFRSIIPRNIVFRRFACAVYVNTTNDGGNYWQLRLRYSGGTIATVDTSAIAPDTWAIVETTTLAPTSLTVASASVYIDMVATGAPGTILVAPAVYVI